MSLRDSKNNVMVTIGSYNSLNQTTDNAKSTSIFSSVNNSTDIVPYMLDTLKVVAGTTALKNMVGGLFTNFVDNVEPKLKTSLKKQLIQYNAGDGLPTYFKSNGAGVSVPMKDVDLNGKFKSNPNSSTGNLLYDKSTPSFDNVAYNSIVNDGTTQSYNNMNVKYNANTDKVTFNSNSSGTVDDQRSKNQSYLGRSSACFRSEDHTYQSEKLLFRVKVG